MELQWDFERGELDLAIVKRDRGARGGLRAWHERLAWVVGEQHPIDLALDPPSLVVFGQGCLYRDRAIHALEADSS